MLTRVAVNTEKCATCKYIFLCGGGCPNPIIDAGESINSPNCLITINVLAELVEQCCQLEEIDET